MCADASLRLLTQLEILIWHIDDGHAEFMWEQILFGNVKPTEKLGDNG